MLRDVNGVIVPDQRTTASWTNCYTSAVDDEFVARVCCAVDECGRAGGGEMKATCESDETAGGVLGGGVNPVLDPYPIRL